MPYADRTEVSVSKSQTEIEKLVRKRGGDQFVSGWSKTHLFVGFSLNDRMMKFSVALPSEDKIRHSFEQEHKRLWRCLLLIIKAKFEIVDSGIQTLEEAFLGDIVMHDGQTMSQWAVPQIERMYRSGEMPKLLPGPA